MVRIKTRARASMCFFRLLSTFIFLSFRRHLSPHNHFQFQPERFFENQSFSKVFYKFSKDEIREATILVHSTINWGVNYLTGLYNLRLQVRRGITTKMRPSLLAEVVAFQLGVEESRSLNRSSFNWVWRSSTWSAPSHNLKRHFLQSSDVFLWLAALSAILFFRSSWYKNENC